MVGSRSGTTVSETGNCWIRGGSTGTIPPTAPAVTTVGRAVEVGGEDTGRDRWSRQIDCEGGDVESHRRCLDPVVPGEWTFG